MTYEFKPGARIPVDPQIAGERLEALRAKHDGRLTPHIVVEDARPHNAPLHKAFEWDDAAAASEYRLDQARKIIRSVIILRPDQSASLPVRAFVQVRQGDDEKSTYTHVYTAMADADMRAQVVNRARAELDAWRRRYQDIEELASEFGDVARSIDALIAIDSPQNAASTQHNKQRKDNGRSNRCEGSDQRGARRSDPTDRPPDDPDPRRRRLTARDA